ncbi:MAG: DUF6069 family protein [Chloroflexi bacterium]|nr:DUF6069 family protein [Chloroflexota bacterium]
MTTIIQSTKPAMGAIWRNGLLAAGVAAVGNTILYVIGSATGNMPAIMTPMGQPLTLFPVLLMSIVPLLLATLAYAILTRLTATRANLIFRLVAALVFIGFLFGPVQLPGAPLGMIILLECMHVVAAGSILYFLTRS